MIKVQLRYCDQSKLEDFEKKYPICEKIYFNEFTRSAYFKVEETAVGELAKCAIPNLILAPNQKINNKADRKDHRVGTIEKDPEYQAFVESLKNPLPEETKEEAVASVYVTTNETPLLKHLRALNAQKAAEKRAKKAQKREEKLAAAGGLVQEKTKKKKKGKKSSAASASSQQDTNQQQPQKTSEAQGVSQVQFKIQQRPKPATASTEALVNPGQSNTKQNIPSSETVPVVERRSPPVISRVQQLPP